MKKIMRILLALLLVLATGVVAFADEPGDTDAMIVYTAITSFDGSVDGVTELRGEDGWNFGGDPVKLEFKGGKFVVSCLEGVSKARLGLGQDKDNGLAVNVDAADAIAFYIENNSTEAIGACYFGELSYTLPALQPGGDYFEDFGEFADTEFGHQQTYNGTDFEDIECYLVDITDNKIYKGREYEEDWGNGYCEIPAGFKGYYICTLETLGHDQCYYAAWGGEEAAKGHLVETCENGKYRKGANILNVGYSIMNYDPDDDANYVIDDYKLVTFNDNFTALDTYPGESEKPTKKPSATPTATAEVTPTAAPEQSADATGETATTAPTQNVTAEPGESTVLTTGALVGIIAGGVVVIAAVVVVIIVCNKKKKG